MRRKDREITEIEAVLRIIKEAKVLHLGLYDGEYPYIIPLNYGFEYTDNRLVFYVHSAKEGHKIDLIKKKPEVCIELECDVEPVSGGETACKYSSAYSSVIARGKAELVSGPAEKIKGLKLLMSIQTGREFEINEQMAASVEVIRIMVESFTAKARPVQPK